MKNSFKTPALYNFLTFLSEQHSSDSSGTKKEVIASFLPRFSSIDLADDQQIMCKYALLNRETYFQPLNLAGNASICLYWDIDSVINYITTAKIPSYFYTISEINNATNFRTNESFQAIMHTVKMNRDKKFVHKLQPIVLAHLSLFPETAIIDGNHRLCEAVCNGENFIEAFLIPSEHSSQFLLPNSREFILALEELNTHLF